MPERQCALQEWQGLGRFSTIAPYPGTRPTLTRPALLFYKRASELSPKERAPWSNLSAAYFELGDYEQAILACDTALGLLTPTDTDSETAKQKLLARKAKSCFFAGLYADAGAETDPASAKSVEIGTLSKSLQSYYSAAKHVEDHMKARNEIVLNLPRYKPTLYVLLQDRRDTF
jgi:tetratricopeptide (TPR) repeat protein